MAAAILAASCWLYYFLAIALAKSAILLETATFTALHSHNQTWLELQYKSLPLSNFRLYSCDL